MRREERRRGEEEIIERWGREKRQRYLGLKTDRTGQHSTAQSAMLRSRGSRVDA